MKSIFIICLLLLTGCASNKTVKPTHQRGWIGGEYRQAKRSVVSGDRSGAVYVKQVYDGTPAAHAGLKPGDVIVAMNDQTTAQLAAFRRCVDNATPGSQATIHILRSGATLDLPVTIGRETFQQWHAVSFGLGLSSRVDLWPDRNFSLLPLAQYQFPSERLELRSPEVILTNQKIRQETTDEIGTRSDEGWNARLFLLGFDAHKRILSQESVATP